MFRSVRRGLFHACRTSSEEPRLSGANAQLARMAGTFATSSQTAYQPNSHKPPLCDAGIGPPILYAGDNVTERTDIRRVLPKSMFRPLVFSSLLLVTQAAVLKDTPKRQGAVALRACRRIVGGTEPFPPYPSSNTPIARPLLLPSPQGRELPARPPCPIGRPHHFPFL